MSIDFRYVKEMLNQQLLRSLDIAASGTSSAADSSEQESIDFAALLQQIVLTGNHTAEEAGNASLGPTAIDAFGSFRMGMGPQIRSAGQSAPTAYDSIINSASAKYGVDSSLVKAVISKESSFKPNVVSSAGAKGLMQLMDDTARGLGVTDSFDPEQNIDGGTRFLSYLLRKYNGNEGVALAAYNAGPGRVDRLGIRTNEDLAQKLHLLPEETQQYVHKVLRMRDDYAV